MERLPERLASRPVPTTCACFWSARAEYVPKQIAARAGNHVVPRQKADTPQRLAVYKTAALPAEVVATEITRQANPP
jgi:hypothetical protein